jgi:hypothetical protein
MRQVTLHGARRALTSRNGRATVLHRDHSGLELGGETVPETLRQVPFRQMGWVVAEGIAVPRAKGTRGFDVGGSEAPAGGTTARMVVAEVGRLVGSRRGSHGQK